MTKQIPEHYIKLVLADFHIDIDFNLVFVQRINI